MAASGGSQEFLIKREATFGTKATGNWEKFRATGGSVSSSKRAITSEIIRDDRSTDSNIEVFKAGEASLESEVKGGDVGHNILFENALFSSLTNSDLTGTGVTKGASASESSKTIDSAVSDTFNVTTIGTAFDTNNLQPGAWIGFDGIGGGADGWWKVVSVTDSDTVVVENAGISFAGAPITHPGLVSGNADESYAYGFLRNYKFRTGLSIERGFTDISEYQVVTGSIANTLNIRLEAEQVARFSAEILSKGFEAATSSSGGTPNAAGTSDSLSASADVVRLYKNGAAIPVGVRSLEFTINNNVTQLSQIASNTAADTIGGLCQVEGTLEAYFADKTDLHDLLVNHTAMSIEFVGVDAQGNLFAVHLPKVNLMEGGVQSAGSNDTPIEQYRISAVIGTAANEDYMIQINSIARPS